MFPFFLLSQEAILGLFWGLSMFAGEMYVTYCDCLSTQDRFARKHTVVKVCSHAATDDGFEWHDTNMSVS